MQATNLDASLLSSSGIPFYIFILVIGLTALCVLLYLVKGLEIITDLQKVISGLAEERKNGKAPKPVRLSPLFESEPLRHLWDEYSDTLHEVKKGGSGDSVLTEVRATVPAEVFFTREVLVDSRLFDEFTRHLPGVLTGLGIIGTFAGLIDGLKTFDPTTTQSAVAGLKPLLNGVSHAFIASGTAIGCAMLVVFLSRLVLAYCYGMVEKLTHGVDSLYATGAGEEYLSRLVRATEQSEANTAQLKDALVEDLTKLMTNLVDRQIAAHDNAIKSLGEGIGKSISDSITGPMEAFGDAVKNSSQNNQQQVSGMLESLLTGFMSKLEETFGSQMSSINEQIQKSMETMAAVQASLNALLVDIKKTNEHATNQFSGALEEAMKKAADNQSVLTEQLRAFVEEFRKIVAQEQDKSKKTMDEAVSKVLADLAKAIEQMETVRKNSADEEGKRQGQMAEGTKTLVSGLSGQVETLLKQVVEQVTKTQQNIDKMNDVSVRAIDGMNSGALNMASAADKFTTAGNSVSGVLEISKSVSETLRTSATALQAAATAVEGGFTKYDASRKSIEQLVMSLNGLIEGAKKEAGVSQELIKNIEASAKALLQAESASRDHLESVNKALVESFNTFGSQLVEQIRKSVSETDKHLVSGTNQLSGVVQGLVQAVQRMSSKA